MRTIFLTKGLPASGKTSWAKDLMRKEPKRWRRINRDDLRFMLTDGRFDGDDGKHTLEMSLVMARFFMDEGFDVVLDNTHLVKTTVKKIHNLAESIGDVKVLEKAFNTSVDECIRRNAAREGMSKVPEKVIRDMARAAGLDKNRVLHDAETYYPPLASPGTLVQDEKLPKAILCDLDGTLALIGDRSPYDASECDTKDKPNWPVIECVKAMYARGSKVIFMSGREDKYRAQTERFIEQWVQVPHGLVFAHQDLPKNVVIPHELHMRSSGDQRKDAIVKRELFDANVAGKYFVQFALDDRDQVCRFWRSIGLSCFQVNYGAF